ncbi:MAG: 4-alpha-glucanotransferase, partial [Sphingobacteriales bacterium]
LPLHSAGLAAQFNAIDWQDTQVLLPDGFGSEWQALPGTTFNTDQKFLVAELFRELPFAVLEGSAQQTHPRGSGLLLHITSLPSPYAIGDLGPEAYRFADFLSASKQRYWQLLPVNPTEAGQGHSPYSSHSSNAGSRLLISPDGLRAAGWLKAEDLAIGIPNESVVDYAKAEAIKEQLLGQAWKRFREEPDDQEAFAAYGVRQRGWLDDFARYSVLKRRNGGKPWYEWPEAEKFRTPGTLKQLDADEADALQQVRWEQWVFEQQWHALKVYCNERGIRLIGDLPFYVSYDSADVWAHRDLFLLDEADNRLGLAGVPPDAFSADGQLWGMPVFRWDVLKEQGYEWWIERLRRNSALFDLVRLDHFRAFAAYWEVPAGAQTAREGSWI